MNLLLTKAHHRKKSLEVIARDIKNGKIKDESVVNEARPGTKTFYNGRDVLPPYYSNSELHDKSKEMFKKSWEKLNDKQKDEVLASFPKNESVVAEAEITSDDQFKEYATALLKKAFGADYDEAKAMEVVDGLTAKYDGDYGAMVGALQSSIG